MYAEAENMDSRICCESCFACLTAYLTYLCIESYFDKVRFKIFYDLYNLFNTFFGFYCFLVFETNISIY